MTDDQWRSHFAEKENSELTISEYTKKHGIILSSWYYHRKRLQKTDSKFVPIKVNAANKKPTITLQFENQGIYLQAKNFDVKVLSHFLAASLYEAS